MTHVDVEAYCRRIGYDGPRTPTLDTLRALVRLQPQVIPFENLNPLSQLPVDISPAALQRKLIAEQRGGYCFEQNTLLQSVLTQFGFEVTGLAARVVWRHVPGTPLPPHTHMLLRVELEGSSRLVDVGFGSMTLTGVLDLQTESPQTTPLEPFRLQQENGVYAMQALVRAEWRTLYLFGLQQQILADYEMMNWYTSTHPASRFRQNLIAARTAPDRRHALLNREFSTHHFSGPSETRVVQNAAELRQVLEEVFLVRVPDSPAFEQALDKALAAP